MNHLMIDLETLGTSADAAVISVGAVKFDLESSKIDDEGFYSSVSIESNLDAGRKIHEDTLLWWLKQSTAAQVVFHEDKLPLEQTLIDLVDWLGEGQWVVWSKGANFDISIMEHAFHQFGMATPWKFWNTRCVRTYMALPGAKGIVAATEGVKHNALSDAYEQAKTVQLIHQKLFAEAPRSSMVKPAKAK